MNTIINELYEKYPSLFSNKDNKQEPFGCYGIEIGDGWLEILSSLCFMIAQHERNIGGRTRYEQKTNPDYISNYQPFKFTQIKEKFGGLTIYYDGGDEYTRGLVGMAGCWSYKTCEKCGEKGQADKRGWITVLCDKCRDNKNKRLESLQKLSDLDQELGINT